MKVEKIARPEPPLLPPHPLQPAIDALLQCESGDSIRVSDLPSEYLSSSPDYLRRALEQATGLSLKVDGSDGARTQESYLVTVLIPF